MIEQSINGGYGWDFCVNQEKSFGSCGAILVSSEYISACLPEARGGDERIFTYWHEKSLADDISLLFLILCFYGMEEADAGEEGEDWTT